MQDAVDQIKIQFIERPGLKNLGVTNCGICRYDYIGEYMG
jgi:hypothetical protein